MAISHDGFTLRCDNPMCKTEPLKVNYVTTERTAIAHARASHWFVGRVRALTGAMKRHPVRHLVLCHMCRWWALRINSRTELR